MCDNIYLMKEGRVLERGTHQELMESGSDYANIVNTYYRRPAGTDVSLIVIIIIIVVIIIIINEEKIRVTLSHRDVAGALCIFKQACEHRGVRLSAIVLKLVQKRLVEKVRFSLPGTAAVSWRL